MSSFDEQILIGHDAEPGIFDNPRQHPGVTTTHRNLPDLLQNLASDFEAEFADWIKHHSEHPFFHKLEKILAGNETPSSVTVDEPPGDWDAGNMTIDNRTLPVVRGTSTNRLLMFKAAATNTDNVYLDKSQSGTNGWPLAPGETLVFPTTATVWASTPTPGQSVSWLKVVKNA